MAIEHASRKTRTDARSSHGDDPGCGLSGADHLGGTDQQISVLVSDGLASQVRFVPYLPFVHVTAVAIDEGPDEGVPGLQRLGRRRQASAQARSSPAGVDRVAVAQAHPRLDALGCHVRDNLVQPRPIVDAFGLLGLGPAGLDPRLLDAQRAQVFAPMLVDRVVPVHRLGANGPVGRLDLACMSRPDPAQVDVALTRLSLVRFCDCRHAHARADKHAGGPSKKTQTADSITHHCLSPRFNAVP